MVTGGFEGEEGLVWFRKMCSGVDRCFDYEEREDFSPFIDVKNNGASYGLSMNSFLMCSAHMSQHLII